MQRKLVERYVLAQSARQRLHKSRIGGRVMQRSPGSAVDRPALQRQDHGNRTLGPIQPLGKYPAHFGHLFAAGPDVGVRAVVQVHTSSPQARRNRLPRSEAKILDAARSHHLRNAHLSGGNQTFAFHRLVDAGFQYLFRQLMRRKLQHRRHAAGANQSFHGGAACPGSMEDRNLQSRATQNFHRSRHRRVRVSQRRDCHQRSVGCA